MPTKAEIQDKLDNLEQDYRRLERAFNQAQLDINALEIEDHDYNTPAISFHAREAIKRAEVELNRVVVDPCDRINAYIRSAEGLGWSWVEPYTKNGEFAWCGAFASFCYTKVRPLIRKKIFPSCYRLHTNWAKTSRYIHPDNLRAGDIVVVYSGKRAVQGDHITLCVDASEYLSTGSITTIEGNAHGTLGDGSRGEGVITRERARSEIAHVYRLLGEDFDE